MSNKQKRRRKEKPRDRAGYKQPDTVVTTIRFRTDVAELASARATQLGLSRTQYLHMLVQNDLMTEKSRAKSVEILG